MSATHRLPSSFHHHIFIPSPVYSCQPRWSYYSEPVDSLYPHTDILQVRRCLPAANWENVRLAVDPPRNPCIAAGMSLQGPRLVPPLLVWPNKTTKVTRVGERTRWTAPTATVLLFLSLLAPRPAIPGPRRICLPPMGASAILG